MNEPKPWSRRKLYKEMTEAGWLKDTDYLLWVHPDGGRFQPFNYAYGVTEWEKFAAMRKVPPSTYREFTNLGE